LDSRNVLKKNQFWKIIVDKRGKFVKEAGLSFSVFSILVLSRKWLARSAATEQGDDVRTTKNVRIDRFYRKIKYVSP
jgi:hypothetical protein